MRRKPRNAVRDLAYQRALMLYDEAVRALRQGMTDLSRRYVTLGLRLLSKANVKKPIKYRRWICKNCLVPLVPGLSCRVRIRRNRKQIIVTRTCLHCGYVVRTPCIRGKLRNQRKSSA